VLPIAISFYTFQQIAFLVDAYRNLVTDFSISRYFLFVTFFPQLIAGPIVLQHEMMPQYSGLDGKKFDPKNLSIGVTIFAIGLFKKVIIADTSAHWADPLFRGAADGLVLTMSEAWVAALAFTFQIYFDFSGYSDMAIGLGWMFGLILPLNFYSPYKATSIIEFWRRWHMTLSRFLRDYLYFPLGGNRHGLVRRYGNLGIVMLLGGLWHGAAWTYVAWGVLHGIYLVINHAWRAIAETLPWAKKEAGPFRVGSCRALTFVAVVFSWVLFRAADFSSALSILKSMVGLNGLSLGKKAAALFGGYTETLAEYGIVFQGLFSNGIMPDRDLVGIWIVVLTVFVMAAPSTDELFSDAPGKKSRLIWAPRLAWGCATGALLFVSLQQFSKITPFLYFQF
jgi:D-alanyl-lipoteichoic acid acyltransferase DltB (MBOAT superfamily)